MNELLFDPEAHRKMGRLLGELLADYEETLADRRVFPSVDRDAMRKILTEALPEEGRTVEELFVSSRMSSSPTLLTRHIHASCPTFSPHQMGSRRLRMPWQAHSTRTAIFGHCHRQPMLSSSG